MVPSQGLQVCRSLRSTSSCCLKVHAGLHRRTGKSRSCGAASRDRCPESDEQTEGAGAEHWKLRTPLQSIVEEKMKALPKLRGGFALNGSAGLEELFNPLADQSEEDALVATGPMPHNKLAWTHGSSVSTQAWETTSSWKMSPDLHDNLTS